MKVTPLWQGKLPALQAGIAKAHRGAGFSRDAWQMIPPTNFRAYWGGGELSLSKVVQGVVLTKHGA